MYAVDGASGGNNHFIPSPKYPLRCMSVLQHQILVFRLIRGPPLSPSQNERPKTVYRVLTLQYSGVLHGVGKRLHLPLPLCRVFVWSLSGLWDPTCYGSRVAGLFYLTYILSYALHTPSNLTPSWPLSILRYYSVSLRLDLSSKKLRKWGGLYARKKKKRGGGGG